MNERRVDITQPAQRVERDEARVADQQQPFELGGARTQTGSFMRPISNPYGTFMG